MDIHTRLRETRLKAGRTLQEVAEHMGLSYQAVQQWEKKDGTVPRGSRLTRLALFYDSIPEYIQFGSATGFLGPDEEQLLTSYAKLSPDHKVMVLNAIEFLIIADGGNK